MDNFSKDQKDTTLIWNVVRNNNFYFIIFIFAIIMVAKGCLCQSIILCIIIFVMAIIVSYYFAITH